MAVGQSSGGGRVGFAGARSVAETRRPGNGVSAFPHAGVFRDADRRDVESRGAGGRLRGGRSLRFLPDVSATQRTGRCRLAAECAGDQVGRRKRENVIVCETHGGFHIQSSFLSSLPCPRTRLLNAQPWSAL